MIPPSKLSVVIPAAGIGSRMNSKIPKQYLQIAGKAVIEYAVAAFVGHPQIQNIVVCIHPKDTHFATLAIAGHPKVSYVVGASSRAESVLNGLQYLANHSAESDANSWVLVHDAARPGLSQIALNRLIEAKEKHSAAILALPVVDTIKRATQAFSVKQASVSMIQTTIDRSHLWQAQTPQMFPLLRLKTALQQAIDKKLEITDEASAMEYLGEQVALIEGEASNLKITRAEDLALAEFYIKQQSLIRESE